MDLKTMMNKCHGFFSSVDPEKEIHLLAYGVGVLASTLWLSFDIIRRPIDGNWCTALGLYLAAITGGLFKGGTNYSKNLNSSEASK